PCRLILVPSPPVPWPGVPALVLPGAAGAGGGRKGRAGLGGGGGTRLPPIAVARMAALAKATSLAAAILGGLAAGFLVYVLGSLDKPAFRTDAVTAGVTLASALILVAAALDLEQGCRVPTPPDAAGDTAA